MNVFGGILESPCLSVRPSVRTPFRGRHCEVRASVHLVSMESHFLPSGRYGVRVRD